MRYLINLSYSGKGFYGFQIQNDKKTIEGELKRVLNKILNQQIKITSSSRTDKGVHAYNQFVHFDIEKELDVKGLKYSINSLISDSIYIKNIIKVSNEFHSRYNVICKEYLYKINVGQYNPIEKDYIFQYNKKINISLLKKAAKKIEGKHNFKSFTSDKENKDYERIVEYIKIKKDKDYVYIYVKSKGFLRYMVRNIVGLLLEINERKKSVSDIKKIFKSEDRRENAVTANPEGLYLNKVKYKYL